MCKSPTKFVSWLALSLLAIAIMPVQAERCAVEDRQEPRESWVTFPLGGLALDRTQAPGPFEEGTKGRLYFRPPHQRPRAVDAIVGRIDRDGVMFRFIGPSIAPPPFDSQAHHVRLSGSWVWTWAPPSAHRSKKAHESD
jgi:hypothetical protein